MTPSNFREIESIVQKARTFTQLLTRGGVDLDAFRNDPAAVVAAHGLAIPEPNRKPFRDAINEILDRRKISKASDWSKPGPQAIDCSACEILLTVAFAAIIILTVAAAAAAIIAAFPEVAGPAAIAFLDSSPAVEIFLGIILTGAGVLAAVVCTDLIKCDS